MKIPNKMQRSIALIAGAVIPVALIGGYVGYTSSGEWSTPDIPRDSGTMMRAIDLIRWWAALWSVNNTQAVDGYDRELFISNSGSFPATWLVCSQPRSFIRKISIDSAGKAQADCITSTRTYDNPILATIRDLDSSCNGQVKNGSTQVSTTDASDVKEGDTITTGSCPLTSLYFVDHSVLRLAANTTLTLSTAGTTAGSGTTDVTLSTGELWARVLKPRIDGSYFEIGTSDGAVGVRGTSVWVKKDNNGTQALAIDSGKDEVTSGAAAITVTGTGVYAIDRKEAKLGQRVSIASSNPVVVVKPDIFSAEAIYSDNSRPLIRAATLRDLADYRSLQDGVGNLRTISMTGSWLRTRDIYSGSVVAGAIGIDITDPNKAFVDREFANTLPTTPTEKANLCKNISGDSLDKIQWTPTNTSPLTYWSATPRGTNACKPPTLSWLADYRKGDTKLYANGGTTYENKWDITLVSDGIRFPFGEQKHSKYEISPINDLAEKTLIITTTGMPTTNTVSKKYFFDFWGNVKVYIQDWRLYCAWRWWNVCVWNDAKLENGVLTATLPPKTTTTGYIKVPSDYTQMIFGNTPTWSPAYNLPIWTTIQSIQIQ